MKHYIINLTEEEREELIRLTTTGRHSALKMLHARILLKTDEGLIDEQIAEHLDINVRTIERVRKRCAHEGVSAAPKGRQRWTLRLLAVYHSGCAHQAQASLPDFGMREMSDIVDECFPTTKSL